MGNKGEEDRREKTGLIGLSGRWEGGGGRKETGLDICTKDCPLTPVTLGVWAGR